MINYCLDSSDAGSSPTAFSNVAKSIRPYTISTILDELCPSSCATTNESTDACFSQLAKVRRRSLGLTRSIRAITRLGMVAR